MSEVRARFDVEEADFPEEGNTHTHARAGETGHVRMVVGEWLTVTWHRTGTTYDVHVSEVRQRVRKSQVSVRRLTPYRGERAPGTSHPHQG